MLNFYKWRYLCLAVPLLFCGRAMAQYNTPIASDPNVRIGRLGNGFTYYVRKNVTPKSQAVLYLAVKVGSVLEEDNQQGLAHFIEHMGFDGTTHYPKNALIDYLQKAGVRFGADLNAYTSFDETVYQLPIPTDDPAILNNGIQIIRDWAQEATLDPAEIEKERGVVLEEKRYRSGVTERINRKIYPMIYNNSRYGKRLPIGTDQVLNNFKPETLSKFYHDWYRPDLEAIIAVGDFNVDNMVQAIKDKFSNLKNPENEKDRKIYNIQLIDDHQYAAVTDPEYRTTYAEILLKHPAITIKTDGDYYNYMVQTIFSICMQNRFNELNTLPNATYSNASAGIKGYPGGLNVYDANVTTTPENLEAGLKTIWRESIRAAKFGFTAAEFTKASNMFYGSVYYPAHEADKTPSASYVNRYLQHFLRGGALPGEQGEVKLAEYFLNKVNLGMVNHFCNQYIVSDNRDIIVMAADRDKAKLPDMANVEGWLNDVQQEDITAVRSNVPVPVRVKSQALIARRPEKSKVLSEKLIDGVNVTEVVLSNGIRIALKPTNFSENDVRFTSFARGGTDVYPDADRVSAVNAVPIIMSSGLGDLDAQQLAAFVAKNPVSVTPYIDKYIQGVSGSCIPKNLETALQLTNQYFTKPRRDSAAFVIYISRLKAQSTTRRPQKRDSTTNINSVSHINFNRAFDIYKERFANAADFTFVFTGDFEVKQILPLLERYLGSLPGNPQNTFVPVAKPATPNKSKTTYSGIEPKANVTLQYAGNYRYSFEDNTQFNALAEVLKIRLIERLRQQESGIYSTTVRLDMNTVPNNHFSLTINFVCAPANAEKLIASALDEINQIKTNGATAVDIEKYKAADKRQMETLLKSNSFWINYLCNQYLNKQPVADVSDYQNTMDNITPESLQGVATDYLTTANFTRRLVLPEAAKK